MITEPNSSDVLLGRGPNFSKYEGNLRFHKLVNERKHEYNTSSTRPDKKRIAKEVVARVHASGGRFLKQADPNDPLNEAWYEVEAPVSEEKAKQALREKECRKSGLDGDEVPAEKASSMSSLDPHLGLELPSLILQSLSFELASTLNLLGSSAMNPSLAHSLRDQCTALSSSLDPRYLLLQDNLITGNPPGTNLRPLYLTTLALRSQLANLTELETATKLRLMLLEHLKNQASSVDAAVTDTNGCAIAFSRWVQAANEDWHRSVDPNASQDSNGIKGSYSDADEDTHSPTPEEENAAFALSCLARDQAKRNLNDEKKEATAIDTFGKACEAVSPRRKRARQDMGPSE